MQLCPHPLAAELEFSDGSEADGEPTALAAKAFLEFVFDSEGANGIFR